MQFLNMGVHGNRRYVTMKSNIEATKLMKLCIMQEQCRETTRFIGSLKSKKDKQYSTKHYTEN